MLAALLDRPAAPAMLRRTTSRKVPTEWNHSRQILQIRLMEASAACPRLYAAAVVRPGLPAQTAAAPGHRQRQPGAPSCSSTNSTAPTREFRAFLLELLLRFSRSAIPGLARSRPPEPPIDHHIEPHARGCTMRCAAAALYWIDFPSFDKELAIVAARAPGWRCAGTPDLSPCPGRAPRGTLQSCRAWPRHWIGWRRSSRWARRRSTAQPVSDTLGVLLKYREDIERIEQRAGDLLKAAASMARHTAGAVAGPVLGRCVRLAACCAAPACRNAGPTLSTWPTLAFVGVSNKEDFRLGAKPSRQPARNTWPFSPPYSSVSGAGLPRNSRHAARQCAGVPTMPVATWQK